MRVRVLSLLAVATMLVSVVSACGKSSGSAKAGATTSAPASSGGSAATGAVRGVTDTSITIGGLASLTSPTGPLFGNADVGAKARFARVNREGGIAGRKINYLPTVDDAADPSRDLDEARKLVLQQKVFSITPALSPVLLPQTTDFLKDNKVPFVGWGITSGFCSNDYAVGFNGCLLSGTAVDNSLCRTVITGLNLPKNVTVAYQGEDSAAQKNGRPQIIQCWADQGAKIVYKQNNVPTTAVTDYSPYAQAIMTSDNGKPPDVAMVVTSFGSTIGIASALKTAGFKGVIVDFISYLPGQLDKLPDVAKGLDGVYTTVQWQAQEFGGPSIDRIKADLKAVGADTNIDIATAASYWSADVLVQLLTKVGRDLTPDKVAALLKAGWEYKPDDNPPGLGPVKYPTGYTDPSGCSSLVQHSGTSYKPILTLTCFPVSPQRPGF
jgi:branched-chain amino acid transport system substrate-binding protein